MRHRARTLPSLCLALLAGCGSDSLSAGNSGPVETRTVSLPGGEKLEMVRIEPGRFRMGSPDTEPGRSADEGPVRDVTFAAGCYLGRYEVTQAQWESVMGTRPWSGRANVREGSDYPAVCVSWDDAQAFTRRLNEAEGEGLYRLPTEAEWEYACRAGTATRWSCGDDSTRLWDYAWYWTGFIVSTYPQKVGTKRPNPWGLYEMHGNAREWVQDGYAADAYVSAGVVDPRGPAGGPTRVVRGGYWRDEARFVRSAMPMRQEPDVAVALIGFRLWRRG